MLFFIFYFVINAEILYYLRIQCYKTMFYHMSQSYKITRVVANFMLLNKKIYNVDINIYLLRN